MNCEIITFEVVRKVFFFSPSYPVGTEDFDRNLGKKIELLNFEL